MLGRRHSLRAFLEGDQTTASATSVGLYREAQKTCDQPIQAGIPSAADVVNYSYRQEMQALRERAAAFRETAREYLPDVGDILAEKAAELERQAASLEFLVIGRGAENIARH